MGSDKERFSTGYALTVLSRPDKPQVVVPAQISHGGEYELRCRSNGGPRPKHLWWFNGKRVDLMNAEERKELNIAEEGSQETLGENYSGILKLNSFTGKNVGDYRCRAENRFGDSPISDDVRVDFRWLMCDVIMYSATGGFCLLIVVVLCCMYCR